MRRRTPGAGWDVVEHAAYGIEFPKVGERFGRLEEELAICRALFTDERATFTGTFYAVRDAYNSPRPVRGSIPVLVAEFDTRDLGALASSARAMAAAGADGMIAACPDDPARIAAIGEILAASFPS